MPVLLPYISEEEFRTGILIEAINESITYRSKMKTKSNCSSLAALAQNCRNV